MPDPTPARRILADDDIDNVANAVLALAREAWVTRDRLMVLEAVLAKHGMDVTAEVEAFQPDEALQARLEQARDRMIDAVIGALNGSA